jgi:hypothetical protein
MGSINVAACAESRTDVATIFAILKDGSTWPLWSGFDAFELEREGHEEPLGIGAIRVFITKVSRAREEVVELVPDRRLSYILLSGFPFRDYRADVDLAALPNGGTEISWRASFDTKHVGTGWFWRTFMSLVLRNIARGLAKAGENPAVRAVLSRK